jgi:hypothetical protein
MKEHPRLDTQTVRRLHRLLDEGRFAVPKLQRAFVWNGRKAADLLDSIYRGMPIGSLTIWETSRKNRNLLRQTTRVLPPFQDHNGKVWFVLDGQQRLSVLYRIATGGIQQNAAHRPVDFDRVCFRVTDGDEDTRFQYRKPVPRQWVPLPAVLATSWRSKLKGLTDGQLNRVERCRTRVFSYRVPAIRVETEDLEEARELFLRINSLGTPLAAADRAFARASQFDLRELAEQAWEALPTHFQGLTYEVMLQTRALLDGINAVGEDAMRKVVEQWDRRIRKSQTSIATFTQTWARQQDATKRAIDLLQTRFRVLDDGLLPSQYMVCTLAIFFYNRPKQPSHTQLREIRKWFWATGLGQRYSGRGYLSHILKDAEFFRKLATGLKVNFAIEERIDPADLHRAQYGTRSSIASTFFCLLVGKRPRYLSNGQEMQTVDFASAANRKHLHHVFPRHELRRWKIPTARMNSVMNLCFMSGEENSRVGSVRPSFYLLDYRDRRGFARIMDSHLIPHGSGAGVWNAQVDRGYPAFLKERAALVCNEFERAAGGYRLFRRD